MPQGAATAAFIRTAALALTALALTGCLTTERLPAVPEARTRDAQVLGLANARFSVGSDMTPFMAEIDAAMARERAYLQATGNREPIGDYLAISGGAEDGAFGAGLLVGWTERGDRPRFRVVTGVSTGALTAPFAFLGPDYDERLRDVYTRITKADIVVERPITAALTGDAVADTKPLFELISRHVDAALLDAIAAEYDKGRLLLVATTNLDAGRGVIWNIGAIAKSRHPQALDTVRRALLASASIPGAFPPVMFDVEVDGTRRQEMHVDGGAVAQVFLFTPAVHVTNLSSRTAGRARPSQPPARAPVVYVLRNGRLGASWQPVDRSAFSIAGRAISTLVQSNGLGDLYRIHSLARRDGIGFRLAFIERDFTVPYKDAFDPTYMQALFAYGREKALTGYRWRTAPPGLSDEWTMQPSPAPAAATSTRPARSPTASASIPRPPAARTPATMLPTPRPAETPGRN
jgi:predicted acylesterase/phospholipase RssA